MKYFFIFIFILLIGSANAQNLLTGSQFKDAAFKSVDVMSSHLLLLQAQSHYNKILNNASLTEHIAPVTMLINNGMSWNGQVSRLLLNTGGGYGNIEKFGVYGGFQGDYIFARGNAKDAQSDLVRCDVVQGIWYLGCSFYGFQFDGGSLFHVNEVPLDNNQEFARESSQVVKTELSVYEKSMTVFTLYHKSGVYVTGVFSKVKLDGRNQNVLSEHKIFIQPLKRFLPDPFGSPFMDLIGYTPLSSYYNKYKDFYSTSFDINKPSDNNKLGYDYTLGSDDISRKGIRSGLTMQVYPNITFRKFELAYNYFRKEKTQVFGSRLQFFKKENNLNVSFDVFTTLSTKFKNLSFSLSYSYNSPDNVTFISLPKLHVIGVQIIFGKRETAKAIIPYAISILSDENDENINDD